MQKYLPHTLGRLYMLSRRTSRWNISFPAHPIAHQTRLGLPGGQLAPLSGSLSCARLHHATSHIASNNSGLCIMFCIFL